MLVIILEGKTFFIIGTFSGLEWGAVDDIMSSFQLLISARICFIPVFPQMTLIFTYQSDALSRPSLVSNNLSQVTFFVVSVKAKYLASINNKAIVTQFLAYQLTKPLFSIKTKLEVNFLVAQLPAQSESKYFFIIKSLTLPSFLLLVIPTDFVIFRYLIIVLTAFVY